MHSFSSCPTFPKCQKKRHYYYFKVFVDSFRSLSIQETISSSYTHTSRSRNASLCSPSQYDPNHNNTRGAEYKTRGAKTQNWAPKHNIGRQTQCRAPIKLGSGYPATGCRESVVCARFPAKLQQSRSEQTTIGSDGRGGSPGLKRVRSRPVVLLHAMNPQLGILGCLLQG